MGTINCYSNDNAAFRRHAVMMIYVIINSKTVYISMLSSVDPVL